MVAQTVEMVRGNAVSHFLNRKETCRLMVAELASVQRTNIRIQILANSATRILDGVGGGGMPCARIEAELQPFFLRESSMKPFVPSSPKWALVCACLVLGVHTRPSIAAEKPNFIVINIDDLGFADLATFGSKLNRTPNLDRMAEEGRKLTSFYAAPVCSPSRAALMTGCYPKRGSVFRTFSSQPTMWAWIPAKLPLPSC